MSNQVLLTTCIVACSLSGWYIVIAKYLALKAQLQDKSKTPPKQIEPVIAPMASMLKTEDSQLARAPLDGNFNSAEHIPGMGLPPLSNMPFHIPPDILESIKKSNNKEPVNTREHPKVPTPQVSTPAQEQHKRQVCNWASIIHLSGLALVTGVPFLNILLPTVLWLLKKEQHPYLAKQGREVINFQISLTILQLACLTLGSLIIWLLPEFAGTILAATRSFRVVFTTGLHLPCNLFTVVPFAWGCLMVIRGAIAAYNGLSYKYPYAQEFIFESSKTSSAVMPTPTPAPEKKPIMPKVSFG